MILKTEQELKDSFNAFSNQETKKITRESLKKWCRKNAVSTSHIEEFIQKFDENEDREVDFAEFVRFYMREEIEAAFKQYDLNGDGKITRKELMTVLRRMGVDNDELQSTAFALMKRLDDNSDGTISYAEFADHFVKENYSFKF